MSEVSSRREAELQPNFFLRNIKSTSFARLSQALLPSEEKEDYGTGTPVKRKQEKPCVAGREWVVETLQSSDFAGFKRGGGVKLDFHDRDLQNLLEYTVQSCHVLRREGRKRRNERKEIRRR